MENKMEDSRLMDFLYGEMSQEDKTALQKELVSNPSLKQQLDEVAGVHDFLGALDDKEVVPPSFVFGDEKPVSIPFVQSAPFRWVSSIAAGLSVLLIAAYLLQLKITKNDTGLQIGFGQQPPQAVIVQPITKDEIQSMMTEVMASYDSNTKEKMNTLESKLSDKIENQKQKNYADLQKLVAGYSTESDQLMRSYVSQINDQNKKMIENFFTVSNDTQKQYMQSVLADFNEFYQNQRSYDLTVIESSIDLMKNNYDVQQLEQNSLLANLYDIVQTQSK
jgi:hypothetical protein